MSKVVIIGAGEIGQALNFQLSLTSHQVDLWDRNPEKSKAQKTLEELIPDTNLVLLCIPSWGIDEMVERIKNLLSPNSIVATPSKGIDQNDLKTIGEVLKNKLPNNQVALISGPMLAEELMAGKAGFAVVASQDLHTANVIKEMFSGSNLKLTESDDVVGVALCGVLKNIYSVCLGIADGLELGSNVKGYLVLMALNEMSQIVSILGGRKETVLGPAGLADFVATGFSDFSKNHQSGYEMAKNGTCELKSEGVASVRSITLMLGNNESFPLLMALDRSCTQSHETRDEFNKLLNIKD